MANTGDTRKSFGDAGEEAAAGVYSGQGCRIIGRNVRFGRLGEIDIIAADSVKKVICFCEVKTRKNGSFAQASEAVGPQKRMRIRKLAALFLDTRSEFAGFYARFDVAEVYPDGNGGLHVEIIDNAF